MKVQRELFPNLQKPKMSFRKIQNLSYIASSSQNYWLCMQTYTFRPCAFTYSKLNLTIAEVFKGFYRGRTNTCCTGEMNTFKNHLSKYYRRYVLSVHVYFAAQPKLSIKSIKSFANTMRCVRWVKYAGVHKLFSTALLLQSTAIFRMKGSYFTKLYYNKRQTRSK